MSLQPLKDLLQPAVPDATCHSHNEKGELADTEASSAATSSSDAGQGQRLVIDGEETANPQGCRACSTRDRNTSFA